MHDAPESKGEELRDTVRRATSGRRTVRLAAVGGELPPPAAAVAALSGLADLSWRATVIGDLRLMEGTGQAALSERWPEVQQAAATHGFSAVLTGWSLEDLEPEQRRVEQALAAAGKEPGRGSMSRRHGRSPSSCWRSPPASTSCARASRRHRR